MDNCSISRYQMRGILCIYRIFLRLERCTNIMKHSLYDAEVSYILDFDVCRSSKILPYLT